MSSRLSDYDYELPRELIANRPLPERDASRMMVLHRNTGTIEHRRFAELKELVSAGDLFVFNDTRVLPARRFSDDGAIELLILERLGEKRWRCLTRPARKMPAGAVFKVGGTAARVEQVGANGERFISLESDIDLYSGGVMPLPPYIRRQSDQEDEDRYQTIFAHTPGAVAAPTAGLHFTPELLGQLPHTFVTLHVGPGTFRPVRAENIADHQMHAETFAISEKAAQQINRSQRVVAVGTTVVRVLEAACDADGNLHAQAGSTEIFIYPPFEFRMVDVLLTNFHLPRSSLLMLVSAFAGRENVLRAYEEAIRQRYRFYSYGDCMLIL